jgi:hypothetical protein
MAGWIANFSSLDFNYNFKAEQFVQEVNAEPGITPNLVYITTEDDAIYLHFDSEVLGGELTILSSLVASHTPVYDYKSIASLIPLDNKYTSTSYTRVVGFIYGGSDIELEIKKVSLLSYYKGSSTGYTVLVYDLTHDEDLGTASFTNTTEETCNVINLVNVPSSASTIEVHVKLDNGGGRIFVNTISLFG